MYNILLSNGSCSIVNANEKLKWGRPRSEVIHSLQLPWAQILSLHVARNLDTWCGRVRGCGHSQRL